MNEQTYSVARPVRIKHQDYSKGDTVKLPPRAAQFWLADGTLTVYQGDNNGTQ